MSSAQRTKVAAAVVVASALGGCYTVDPLYVERRDSIALSSGDAIATNKITQMVDPWPRASANRNIAFNGQRMQGAIERYRTNKVTNPVSATTSSVEYQGLQPVVVAPTSSKP
jgi:hypothetical protein